jgi:hydrogenase-4 component B
MAISAYFLVVRERERPEVRRAGLLYLVATHAGTLALFALFAAWAGGGRELTFAALAGRAALLPAHGALVLALALAGFGVKAGIVPLHVWLPEAHAAAPSHVSAIMSGVVIKAGVYGLLRVVTLLGTPPAWWGWLVVALGATSGILGVLWALAQHDLKRLLAFHSVENIGIILLGAGAGCLGITYRHPAMAVLGFAGAALHTLNHALFKSLLFLGAGATIRAAGTRDLDRLGGLAKRMPWTAGAFVVGSAAIVGLPPLNGFVSEWLVYRSLLSGAGAGDASRLVVLAAAALALIGALALACFAKVVGVVYLGTRRGDPRQAECGATAETAEVAETVESSRGMLGPSLALAAACTAIGLAPVLVLAPALRVGALVGHAALAGRAGLPAGAATAADAGTAMGTAAAETAAGPLTVFSLALAAGLGLAWLLRARLAAARQSSATVAGRRGATPATAETWGCGYTSYTAPTPRMQYTASSFAAPLLLAFGRLATVREERSPGAFATHASDPVLAGLVLPAWRRMRAAADRLRLLQRGRLALYLVYMIAALLVLLLYLMVFGRPPGAAP